MTDHIIAFVLGAFFGAWAYAWGGWSQLLMFITLWIILRVGLYRWRCHQAKIHANHAWAAALGTEGETTRE